MKRIVWAYLSNLWKRDKTARSRVNDFAISGTLLRWKLSRHPAIIGTSEARYILIAAGMIKGKGAREMV